MIGGVRQPLLTENRKALEEPRKLEKLVSSRDWSGVSWKRAALVLLWWVGA